MPTVVGLGHAMENKINVVPDFTDLTAYWEKPVLKSPEINI